MNIFAKDLEKHLTDGTVIEVDTVYGYQRVWSVVQIENARDLYGVQYDHLLMIYRFDDVITIREA